MHARSSETDAIRILAALGASLHLRTVLGELAKRLVNLVVVALAAVTFFLVPLRSKTLFEHCKAIFTTPAAGELGRELKKTGEGVVHTVVDAGK
jgi:hypothetical protein